MKRLCRVRKLLVFFCCALMVALSVTPAISFADASSITLSDVWLYDANSRLDHQAQINGTVLTIENPPYAVWYAPGIMLAFKSDTELKEDNIWKLNAGQHYGNSACYIWGEHSTFTGLGQRLPIDTDPSYYIYKLTLQAKDGSKSTEYTLRVRKYTREKVATGWENLFIGLKAMSLSDFKPVTGQTDVYEYIVGKDVTFPYSVNIECYNNYENDAYFDGVSFTASERSNGLKKTLTFTSKKTYYDIRFVKPEANNDSTVQDYVPTTWRLRVTGSDGPDTQPTIPAKTQFTYSLTAKTYNGKAQAITVTPKSGVGKVTAVYYNGSATVPKNAGSYAITIDAAAGTQYGAVSKLSLGTFTINKANVAKAKITIADTAWTGKQIKPSKVTFNGVSMKVSNISAKTTYGANRNIGKGTIKITGKGANFTGSKTIAFKIVPKKIAVKKVAVGAKQMKVNWSKASAAQKISRYEVRYRVKGAAAWKTKSYAASASSATMKSLKKGMVYEVQVRSYKTVSGAKYYGEWSAVKTSGKIK